MAQTREFRRQADRAKRLAGQVTDAEVRRRLLETADEYSKYAELFEGKSAVGQWRREPSRADA